MEQEVDHYQVLGLPSGEEGTKLTIEEITKAYKLKALKLHPDKNPDDPNAATNFQRLRSSFDVLSNEKTRKLFDDLLRIKRQKKVMRTEREAQYDVKRQKMMSDLEKREKEAFTPDPAAKAREEEERIKKKLQEEIAKIRAMHGNRGSSFEAAMGETVERSSTSTSGSGSGGNEVDKEKVLKVTWDKVVGGDYSAEKLRLLFGKFGEVEDVVIRSSKKKGSALVVMASKEGAVAATGNVVGDISNPLLVLPLKPAAATHFSPIVQKPDEMDNPGNSNLVGAGYQAFENSVLEKLRKAAQKQK